MKPTEFAVIAAVAATAFVAFTVPRWLAARRDRRAAMRQLDRTWGQPLRSTRDERPVDALTPSEPPLGCHRLDPATWADLDMPRVFERIDRTLCSVGAQVLHRMLRCPAFERDELARRHALTTAVAGDPQARVAMQRALLGLGDTHGWYAASALRGRLPRLPGPVWLLRLLPLAMAASLLSGIVLGHAALVFSGLALALALPVVHTLTNRSIGPHLETVADVRRVLDVADALVAVLPPALRPLLGDVVDRVGHLRSAFGRVSAPRPSRLGETTELAAEYARAFALTEFVAYQRATSAIAEHRGEYLRVLDLVGELDAALSIAYLRSHDDALVDAEITPDAVGLVATDVLHPLVVDAVGNDVALGPSGLLVTGSNMAGKSTLLRAIAVDAVLAQAIGLAAARTWRSRPLRVLTAMGAHDDLAAGVSLFRAEVDRIHTLVDAADGTCLFVLDEALRGTNPHERIAASAAVLRRLSTTDLVVAATHDRELCGLLEPQYALGHFTEQVDGDDVVFDYRLRPGVLQSTNAIALLERSGFPAELVAEARALAGDAASRP